MTRRLFMGAGIVSALALLLPGCSAPGDCVYYFGGSATPECSAFEPGEVVARATARSGDTVAQLRDRVLAQLSATGVDTSRLTGLLGWGVVDETIPAEVVPGGSLEEPHQVTDEGDPEFPENYEFFGGEVIALFLLSVTAVVAAEEGEVAVDALDRVATSGNTVVLRGGRVLEGALTDATPLILGDEVVVY